MNSNVCCEVASSLMPVMAGRPEGIGPDMVKAKDKGKVFAELFSQNMQNQDLVSKEALSLLDGLDTPLVVAKAQEQSQIQEDMLLPEDLLKDMDASDRMLLGIQMSGLLTQPTETVLEEANNECGLQIQDPGSEIKVATEGLKNETLGQAISMVAADSEKPPDKVQRLHLLQQTFSEVQVSNRESTKTLPPGQWTLIPDQASQHGPRRALKESVPKGMVVSDHVKREEFPLQRAMVQNLNLDKREVEIKLEPQPVSGEFVADAETIPDRNQIVQQMAKSIENARWDKGEYLRVRLEPEYLGELRIDIQKTEAGCVARISAQKQSVKKLLAPRIEEIANLLSERMIKVDQIIVDTLRPEVAESSLMHQFNQSGMMQQNMTDGESQTHQGAKEKADVSGYSVETPEEEQNQEIDGTGINIVI